MLFFTLIICVSASLLFTFIAKKLNISVVVGLIISGIILGSPLAKNVLFKSHMEIITKLGDLGFFLLMFLAGMEISWCLLYEERKEAATVAFFAALSPFVLGFSIFLVLGYSAYAALAIGICMGITAEATKARVLLELKKMDTQIGSIMMGAGIIDDILGLSAFALISFLFTSKFSPKELMHTLVALFAFFLGILVHRFIGREKPFIAHAEKLILTLIIPFFFIGMGINFSFSSLILDPWLFLLIISIALIGKIAGTLLAKPFLRLTWKQLYLVGWGMNSRGAVELAIAFLALRMNLIPIQIYSGLVIMALTTTLIFPFVLRGMIKKDPQIMGGFSSCKLNSNYKVRS
jgi:Kef-type K+ transport system membrane component KefB